MINKNNWIKYALIAAVFIIFLLTKPFNCNNDGGAGTVKSDTVTVTRTDTVFSEKLTKIKEYIPIIKEQLLSPDTVYQIHENYDGLVKQYKELAIKYTTLNKYQDTIKMDSFGHTVINYSVQNNEVKSFSGESKYTIPTITETKIVTVTNTVKAPEKSKVFLGGEVVGDSKSFVNGAYGGVLFENKRGTIYGLKGGLISADGTVRPSMGLSAYWKIGKK